MPGSFINVIGGMSNTSLIFGRNATPFYPSIATKKMSIGSSLKNSLSLWIVAPAALRAQLAKAS
jgi:hypothetical protein